MPDPVFRLMTLIMGVMDLSRSRIDPRVQTFGIKPGMTVVDYGCGPGRYTVRFSKRVGEQGRVYAVDIHELAIAAIGQKRSKLGLRNVTPVLAHGYNTGLPDHVADVVCALDMFFMIRQPTEFLQELARITAQDGRLIIDDGHQPRALTKQKIMASGLWTIEQETNDHLVCKLA